jgi:hypothetical protein
MQRSMPISILSLLCIFATFAGDSSAAEEPTQNAQSGVLQQLLGTWDVRYEFIDKSGKARTNRGRVHYSSVLGGKALQETWSSDSESPEPQPFGMTIDFYDPKRKHWTAIWIYPAQGDMTVVTGGEVDGSFVLTGRDQSGALQRWTTSIVERGSAVGRFHISHDDGKSWKEVGVNYMRRHGD